MYHIFRKNFIFRTEWIGNSAGHEQMPRLCRLILAAAYVEHTKCNQMSNLSNYKSIAINILHNVLCLKKKIHCSLRQILLTERTIKSNIVIWLISSLYKACLPSKINIFIILFFVIELKIVRAYSHNCII
jgi:hypothetical protein